MKSTLIWNLSPACVFESGSELPHSEGDTTPSLPGALGITQRKLVFFLKITSILFFFFKSLEQLNYGEKEKDLRRGRTGISEMNNAAASRVWRALSRVHTHTLQLLMSSMPKIRWKIITIHRH